MKNFTKTILSIALVSALTACGSSGGGSNGHSENNPAELSVLSSATQTSVATSTSVSTSTPQTSETTSPSNVSTSTPQTSATTSPSNVSTSTPQTSATTLPSVSTSITPEEQLNSTENVANAPSISPQLTPETKLENTGISINKDNFIRGEIPQISIENNQGNEIAKLSGYNRAYSFNGALTKTTETGLSEIIVDNVVLNLADKAGSLGGLTGFALSKTISSFYNASKDPERDIFYFGNETAVNNIPTSGIVIYQGNATRYDNVSSQVKNIGTSELTADFDNKKIQGELKIDGLFRRNITLKETDITGNGFKGTAVAGKNHILVTRTGEYEGKFYGPNAEELAGKASFAEAQKDLNTSFSAEKLK